MVQRNDFAIANPRCTNNKGGPVTSYKVDGSSQDYLSWTVYIVFTLTHLDTALCQAI